MRASRGRRAGAPTARSFLALLLIATTGAVHALGFEAGFRLETDFGFDEVAAAGRWAPLRINWDDAPPGARLEVTRFGREDREGPTETFVAASSGSVECPVPVLEGLSGLRVRMSVGSEILAERRLRPLDRAFPGHLVLALGLPSELLRAIAASLQPLEPVRALEIAPLALPALPLDLDGVAAMVLRDPGRSLSPAQIAALRSWLAAGGRMAVLDAREGEAGLVSSLGVPGSGRSRSYGLGAIESFAEPPEALAGGSDPAFWRRTLALRPFGHDGRLAAGRLPDLAGKLPGLPSPVLSMEPAVAFIGMLWFFFLVLAARKARGAGWMASISILFALLAIPCSSAVQTVRRGLAAGTTRALVLPDGSILAGGTVEGLQARGWDPLLRLVPKRGLGFSFGGSETGTLGPSPTALRLEHDATLARASPLSVVDGVGEFLTFSAPRPGRRVTTASQSASSAAASGPESFAKQLRGRALLARAGQPRSWFVSSPSGWTATDPAPASLGRDSAWALRLLSEYTDYDFIFSRDPPGEGWPEELRVEGGAAEYSISAYPFLAGPR